MKALISILIIAWGANVNAQTFWTSREYRIPGLGQESVDIGLRQSSWDDAETTSLSLSYGREKSENLEWGALVAIGSTDVLGDDYLNLELGGDLAFKYEHAFESGAKLVPYVRGGITGNFFSNYRETTIGYTWTHRYFYSSGESYFDVYGNYSAGLSYIGVENKWGVSSEIGQYRTLFGDLDFDYEDTTWTSQIYFKLGESSGIKLIYSVESDSEMETIGAYFSKAW